MGSGNKAHDGGGTNGEHATESRRNVLRGVGGAFGALSGGMLIGGGGRTELRQRLSELHREFGDLSELDLEALGNEDLERVGAVGERMRDIGGDCGPEPFEVHGGPIEHCCDAHDSCCTGGPPCGTLCNAGFAVCVGAALS